jgi:hypothetical protein
MNVRHCLQGFYKRARKIQKGIAVQQMLGFSFWSISLAQRALGSAASHSLARHDLTVSGLSFSELLPRLLIPRGQ